MKNEDCCGAIRAVAEAGWKLRDFHVDHGMFTREVVTLEVSLHNLEDSLARLAAALARHTPDEG